MPPEEYTEPLWAEQIPHVVVSGAERALARSAFLAELKRMGPVVPGPYLYVLFLIGMNLVLYAVQYRWTGSAVIVDNPSWIVFPVILLLVTFTNQHLRDRYVTMLAAIRIEARTTGDVAVFERLTPPSSKRLLLFVFLCAYYGYIIGFGRIDTIVAYEGATGLVIWLVLAPFGYAPFLVETIAIYFSIHFLLPHRIQSEGVQVDFLDPDNFGGLKPVGDLLKYSHYLFSVALTLFTLFIYLPFLFPEYFFTPYRPPDDFVTVFVLALWAIGTVSLTYSILRIYRYMKGEREGFLETCEAWLDTQLASRYEFEALLDATDANEELAHQLRLLDQAQKTHDFPVTVSMWTQIVFSTLLPILVELFLRTVTEAV